MASEAGCLITCGAIGEFLRVRLDLEGSQCQWRGEPSLAKLALDAKHHTQLARMSHTTLFSVRLAAEVFEQLVKLRTAFQALQFRVVSGFLRRISLLKSLP